MASSAAERAARAGWGLSAASIHWGRRAAAPKPLAVTERDRLLLALLHDVNYLSSSQLALLGWGADSTCTRRRLRLLHDRGLIDKFRPAAPAGSYEWNYRLTEEGWRMLSDRGMFAERKLYKPAEIHSIAYVEHDLQVNALVLDIAHRARAGEGPLLEEMPFAWHGPRSGEIDPREEQAPEEGCETRVAVWGPLAETCAAHLTKGRLVGVSARLEPTAWEAADGAKRRGMEVIAGTVEFLERPRRDTDSSEQQSQDIAVAA